MPNEAELNRMRKTAREKLPDLATIKRPISTQNGYGGTIGIYSTISTVPCRIQRLSNTEFNVNGAIGEFKIALPALTDVTEKDQIIVDGETYAVVGAIFQKSFEITREVIARKIDG